VAGAPGIQHDELSFIAGNAESGEGDERNLHHQTCLPRRKFQTTHRPPPYL